MASAQDTKSRKEDSDQSQMEWNQRVAEAQRDKTRFRASNLPLRSDKFNPERLLKAN